MTLPTYTCSSEDILKHASKLLKAELPASVRLMGKTTKYICLLWNCQSSGQCDRKIKKDLEKICVKFGGKLCSEN